MIFCKWGSAFDRRGSLASEYSRKLLDRQTMPRSDGAHIFSREFLTGFHVFHNKKRAAEDPAGLLCPEGFISVESREFGGA
jgi:hypothetical protein